MHGINNSDQTNNIFSPGCAGTSEFSGKKTSKAKRLSPYIGGKACSHHCDNTKPQAQTNSLFWDNHWRSIPECQRIIPFLTNSKPLISLSFTHGRYQIQLMTPNVGWPLTTKTSTIRSAQFIKPQGTSMVFDLQHLNTMKRSLDSVQIHNLKIWKVYYSSQSYQVDNETLIKYKINDLHLNKNERKLIDCMCKRSHVTALVHLSLMTKLDTFQVALILNQCSIKLYCWLPGLDLDKFHYK